VGTGDGDRGWPTPRPPEKAAMAATSGDAWRAPEMQCSRELDAPNGTSMACPTRFLRVKVAHVDGKAGNWFFADARHFLRHDLEADHWVPRPQRCVIGDSVIGIVGRPDPAPFWAP
jgi:hypothetical protein